MYNDVTSRRQSLMTLVTIWLNNRDSGIIKKQLGRKEQLNEHWCLRRYIEVIDRYILRIINLNTD